MRHDKTAFFYVGAEIAEINSANEKEREETYVGCVITGYIFIGKF